MRQIPNGGTVLLFLFVENCKKAYSFSQNHEADPQVSQQGFLFGVWPVCLLDLKSAQTTLKKAEFAS